jgi:cytidine deaminase
MIRGGAEDGDMTGAQLDQRLVDAAIRFVERRFPGVPWAGAAAMYTDDGSILVSTALEVVNDSVALCHEVGAMCEAYARDRKIVATVCVSRADDGRFVILPACGVCQERLWYWGGKVQVAVPLAEDSSRWEGVTLAEMSPHYWGKQFHARTSD